MAVDSRFYRHEIEELAHSFGLNFYLDEFAVVPPSFMTEVAACGRAFVSYEPCLGDLAALYSKEEP